jgi:starch synthase
MTIHVLSVASEVFPFLKTGGLADVTGALPGALEAEGVAVRTLMPGYPIVLKGMGAGAETVWSADGFFGGQARILSERRDGIDLLVLDAPHLYERFGGPYQGPDGIDYADNALRFAALSKAGALIGQGALGDWRPDVVHAHDWQAALTPVYLSVSQGPRPRTVLTVHNLAFQGTFRPTVFEQLELPASAWSIEGVEYYGEVGFLKGGLHAADAVTTVSPTYAREILAPEGGMGLDGLLRGRGDRLVGIVNGIDTGVWNPETDPAVPKNYSARTATRERRHNKRALEAEFGLEPGDGPILSVVSRLTWQKGLDLVAEIADEIVALGARLAVVGSGDRMIEGAFLAAHARHPAKVGVRLGYDEPMSHRVQAGADAILIPSRFEPCGLTQLYGLRYGCVPLVADVGGLADTVIDANFAAQRAKVATGFVFAPVSAPALLEAVRRLLDTYRDEAKWRSIQTRGMAFDVSWTGSAALYAALYRDLLNE